MVELLMGRVLWKQCVAR